MLDIHDTVTIEPGVNINVKHLKIGPRSIIRAGARIEGHQVELGTECYLDYNAWIGGGSCFDTRAYLKAGDWLHMGWNSHINIARGVDIGHEVGVGVETKIFTHGAYLPADQGFPVQWKGVKIGDRVWLPNAWVNPGVTIGDNVVVAAKSLVNSNLPEGCLAGGVPAEILKIHAYPKKHALPPRLFDELSHAYMIYEKEGTWTVWSGGTCFDLLSRKIVGRVTPRTRTLKEQLRRNGIRFRFKEQGGVYVPW